MRDLTSRALDTATALGATYADVRVVRQLEEAITIKSGARSKAWPVARARASASACSSTARGASRPATRLSTAEADRVAAEAVRIARASATAIRRPVVLDDRPPATGRYETPVEEDPFAVPLEHKLADLMAADEALRRVDGIAWTESMYAAQRDEKTFAASDGSYTEQVITHVGAGLEANVIDGDEHQRRSYPDNGGLWASAGYEHVRAMDLAGNAERIAERGARAASPRRRCRPGVRTIVLHPSQLYMQVHESCGHPTELDRAYGTEASYAGTSFLTPDMLGSFRYGSDLCDIVADATVPGGLGSFGWDDEGVAAQSVPIIKEGMFVGYLSSRETAPRIGRQSGGAMRADGWNRIPLIRMTNVNLLPKPGMTFEDIVADTDDGLLFETNRSWSIDDRRLNFQFGTEMCREIKGGKVGKLYRNAHVHRHHLRAVAVDGRRRRRRARGGCGARRTAARASRARPATSGTACPGARFRNVRVGVVA